MAQQADPRILKEFHKQKMRQWVVTLIMLLAIGLIFLLENNPGLMAGTLTRILLPGIAILLIGGAAIFSFINWRCPNCHRYLGKGWNPKFCSRCGAPLQ